MANPNPIQTEEFLRQQYKAQGEVLSDKPLSKKAIAVRLPEDIDALVRSQADGAAWLRRVIVEAARRELMGRAAEE